MELLTRLKTETSRQHEQTELLMNTSKLMAGLLSPEEYGQLLTVHFLYHQALETEVAKRSPFFDGYQLNLRTKTPWLRTDCQQLDMPLPTPCSDLFADWSNYQLLGALYVAEGSTLGGRFISSALRRTPGLSKLAITSRFFGGYGEQTGPLWKSFCQYLTAQADGQDKVIVDAAKRAFDYFQVLCGQSSPAMAIF